MSKIARKTSIQFGGSAGTDQIAQFGSLAAASPAFSTDPAVIQALANWAVGWFDGVETGNSPAIEDMNAFCFVDSYQLAYLMQAGVAEWDSGTTYFIGSLCTGVATGIIYVSLTNNNLNHAVSDPTNWQAYVPASALTLATPRTINGVSFNGSANIVVTAAAGTLTGTTLASNVVTSSLTSVGTLVSPVFTSPVFSTIVNTGILTLPTSTDTLVGRATTDTLTNKTIAAGSNTISGLVNANLSGSAAVSNANLASMATLTIKGNNTGGGSTPLDLTVSQVQTMLGTSGTNTGDVSLAAVGAAPSANGATLSGQVLTLQPADATHPGALTILAQTIAGAKTLTGNFSTSAAVATSGCDTSTPTTGGTVTASANKPGVLITPAGTLATLTIKLPPTPIDGQQYWVASSQVLTSVTWQDSGGLSGNVFGGPSPVGGTGKGCRFVFNTGIGSWYNIG